MKYWFQFLHTIAMNKKNISAAFFVRAAYIILSGLSFAMMVYTIKYFFGVSFFATALCLVPFFSALNIEAFSSIWSTVIILRLVAFLLKKNLGVKVFGFPTFAARLAWDNVSFAYVSFVSLLSLVLFCMHPTGSQAFIYSFYWLIPLVSVRFAHTSLYARALTASFVAHAVGSVLFLTFVPTTPEYWIALMPRVLIERCVSAALMVCMHYVGVFVAVRIQKYVAKSSQVPAF